MLDEGYIKYQANWEKEVITAKIPASLVHMRNTLHVLGWIGVLPDGIGFGNISMRESGEHFFISGTQTGHIPVATQAIFSRVVRVDIENNTLWCAGPVQASSEAMTHAAIYAADAQVHAVIHIHHTGLWSYLLERVPVIDAAIPYGTPALALAMQKVVRASGNARVVVTAGHQDGIFAYGPNLETAFKMLKQYYDAWSTNKG